MKRFLEEYAGPGKGADRVAAELSAESAAESPAGSGREFHAGDCIGVCIPPAHVVLGRNYRCAPEIVDASAKVIACNRQRVPKQLTSGREPGGCVQLKGFADGREEQSYVLSQCQGRTPQELDHFAVLFRTNGLMGIFAAQLMQAGIPL